jgi:thiosulfate/3-mercaptopyruvate sulfurtransferase
MRTKWIFSGAVLAAILFAGCSLTPTKVYDSKQGFSRILQDKTRQPILIQDTTVVVDARSSFDFTMAHYPGSANLQWDDFTQKKSGFPGRIVTDLEQIKERLRVNGLHPNRPIVVVGYGSKGRGEAGRMAWMLLYLGYEDVQVVGESALGLTSNQSNPPPVLNEKDWPVNVRASMVATKEEVKAAVTSTAMGADKIYLIDVRSKAEYFAKRGVGQGYTSPDVGAIHIEWTEFFTSDGRPNLKIKQELQGIGINESNRVIVLSNQGLRSGAVSYALVTMGYFKTGNFVDGLPNLK